MIATLADVSWQANGAWGERRFNQWNGPLDNLLIPTSTAKGFTDHEHLDAVGLIHMNGRVYDPELGRFMSADPFVQAPYNSQSYNRYSYVFNNPLSFTDPSGYECYEVKVGSETAGGAEGSEGNKYDFHNQTISTGGSLCGWDAHYFSQDWLNNMERYLQAASPYMVPQYARQSMEFNSAVLGVPNTLDLMDAQAAESAQEISDELQASGHATIATLAGIVVLTYGDKKGKKNGDSLTTKTDTPHTIVSKGKAPSTSSPNSIFEVRRADGSRSITYYDDKGRAFSREDYGQQSTHGSLGQRADGRSVAHEHRFDYNDRGYPIKQDVYRPLSENGIPAGPWRGE